MMQYDFIDGSTEIGGMNGLDTKENMQMYQTYPQQDNFFKSSITTSDIWQSNSLNSNSINQSYYFNNSSNPSQYNYDYQSLPDTSSSYLIDPYSQMFTNNYSIQSTSMDYSTSSSYTDSYQHMYTNPPDYHPTTTQWDSSMMKMYSHDITTASNFINNSTSANKQPCLVCHDESSGYHFGAYTCESCKAFYRRVTKDPHIEIKHSCEVPLSNITKSNRKDCRACRKAKCDRVGMTAMSKDRPSRTTTKSSSYKTPPISITELLEQLGHDLTYEQLSTSTALENILHIIELPSLFPINFDYHSLYMNAIRIWRNQYNYSSEIIANASLIDTFAVLLFLFYVFITNEDQSTNNSKFDKLVNILQQEIYRIAGTDHRSACRLKALFMKCYVALAQYQYLSQSQFIPYYQQYQIYSQ